MVKVELQTAHNFILHSPQLSQCVSICSYIDEIGHSWWIDLFILAGNPQARNSTQLVLLFGDYSDRLKMVQVAQCQV